MLTPGEILKKRRQAIGKTIFEVSQETRILEKYIKQIEANQYDLFDSAVFARGFIKIYAVYLGLDDEKVLALFRRESKDSFKQVKPQKRNGLSFKQSDISKLVLYVSSFVILLIFLIYSIVQIRLYQEIPTLQIINPISGFESSTQEISVEGLSTQNSDIYINNNKIETDKGVFKSQFKLAEGENTLTIKAINKRNKNKITENIVKVFFKKPIETKVETATDLPDFYITLKVKNEASWIKLIVDDKQKLAQTVNAGYNQKHKFTKSFEVVSGRIENTQVYINDKLWPLKINSDTGIASLSCKLENSEVICPQ